MTKIIKMLGCNKTYSKDTFNRFGVEYEIEAIDDCDSIGKDFKIVIDHSLRNNGKEFITYPVNFDVTLELFSQLHRNLILNNVFNPFSDRTSIHVHVNMSHLTIKEVVQFVRMYVITEPIWMRFAGPVRANNIFCVPLYSTYLPKYYNSNLTQMIANWHKYTAFNLLPLKTLGTIEFRHLYGTDNLDIFTKWMSSINNLINWSRTTSDFDIIAFLTKGNVASFIRKVLEHLITNETDDELEQICAPTMLDLKLSFI
jgi:hypothetical protein